MGKLSGRPRLYDSSSHIEDKRRNCETKKRKRGINVTSLRLPRQSAGFGRGREKFYDQLQRRTERRKARRGRAIKLARQNTAGARRRRRPASQPTSINGTHLSVSVFDHWNRYFSWGTGSAGGRMAAAAGGDREHLGRDGRQTRHCRGGRNMNLFKGKLELVADRKWGPFGLGYCKDSGNLEAQRGRRMLDGLQSSRVHCPRLPLGTPI